MFFVISLIVQLLILQATFAQYQLQDFYSQNFQNYLANIQQGNRRCPRHVNSSPINTVLNGPNNGITLGNAALHNMRYGININDFQPNMPVNIPSPLVTNMPNNGLSPNLNGLTNLNNIGGNGFMNSNCMHSGNGLTSNKPPTNYFNSQMNNPVPNLNNFPQAVGCLNSNSISNGNLLPDNNVLNNNWLPNGNSQLISGFPQNVFPINSEMVNPLKIINNDMNPGFNNYNNLPTGNNNLLVNNMPPVSGNNIPSANMNPFNINCNMPLHTVVPSTVNMPRNVINNGIPFLNNNQFSNNALLNGNGMSMCGLPNNLAISDNFQNDLNNLANEQNIVQSIMPSLSNLKENLYGFSNNLNLASNLQMDGYANMPMASGLQFHSLPNNMNNLYNNI